MSQAVDLLKWELSTLTSRTWEDLPELKRKKVVLASRLRAIDPASNPSLPEPADALRLKSQISDLEVLARQKIESQIDLIGHQILALQEVHQYCLESLNISFRINHESTPSS